MRRDVKRKARLIKNRLKIRDTKRILNLTESTGLFSLNVAYALDRLKYPDIIQVYVEPEVTAGYITHKLDYAIIVKRKDITDVVVLAEVKRITTTNNLSDYVGSSFKLFKDIQKETQNYFTGNKFLVLHIHLTPYLSNNIELYHALKALDNVSLFNNNIRVIVTRSKNMNTFIEELGFPLRELISSNL